MIRQLGVLLYGHAGKDGRLHHAWQHYANLSIANVFLRGQRTVDGSGTWLTCGNKTVPVEWPFIIRHLPGSTGNRIGDSIMHVVSPLRIRRWIRGVLHVAAWERLAHDISEKGCIREAGMKGTKEPL